jgi:hypothetical protein
MSNNTFDRYILALRKTPVDEKTELTDRAVLQSLLQAIAGGDANRVTIQHEPKRVADKAHRISRSPEAASFSATSRTRPSGKTSTRS